MASVYFGGSRSKSHSKVWSVVAAVVAAGHSVHVGCQYGIDQQVVAACPRSSLVVFAVASIMSIPNHLQVARFEGARVISCAGGTVAPMPARYLLRSIAAFQGCSQAVFFEPGPGSLAVAREFINHYQKRGIHPCNGIPVFAFSEQAPAPIPQQSGSWVASSFMGFSCWQWQAAQQSLF